MKKIIALISLIGSAYASEITCEPQMQSSYTYGTIGLSPLPIPAPTFGLGRRAMLGKATALDFGAEWATLIYYNLFSGYANGLLYFKRKPTSQVYMGLGGTIGMLHSADRLYSNTHGLGYATPNLILGREFLTRKGRRMFFQIDTKYPLFLFSGSDRGFLNWGFLDLKWGIAF